MKTVLWKMWFARAYVEFYLYKDKSKFRQMSFYKDEFYKNVCGAHICTVKCISMVTDLSEGWFARTYVEFLL